MQSAHLSLTTWPPPARISIESNANQKGTFGGKRHVSGIPSKEELVEIARQLATPIDFDQLEKEGIIQREGAWFRVKNLEGLPKHVSRQAGSYRSDGKGGFLLKFPKSWKRAQQIYRRMTGKEYNE